MAGSLGSSFQSGVGSGPGGGPFGASDIGDTGAEALGSLRLLLSRGETLGTAALVGGCVVEPSL